MEILLWRQLLVPYDLAVQELVLKFQHMITQYRQAGLYSPIEAVNGRVKKITSILEKARRKGISEDEITEKIDDIAGVRIMCQFVEDINDVVKIIRNMSDIHVVNEVDYIRHPKESGYSSYHMNITYEVMTIYGSRTIPVEIQIRTMAMNFWATIEHSLHYKYKGNLPEDVSRRMLASAKSVQMLDNEMSSIRYDIMDAQMSFEEKAVLVRDIIHNIENLYQHFGESADAIRNIQDEFQEIYDRGDLNELKEFGYKLDLLAAHKNTQSI